MAENQLNQKYREAVAKVVNQSPYFSLLSMEIKDLTWHSQNQRSFWGFKNPKSEYRAKLPEGINPKQIRNPNVQMTQTKRS